MGFIQLAVHLIINLVNQSFNLGQIVMEKINEKSEKDIVFFIDKKQLKTVQSSWTIKELLEQFAKVDPTRNTIALRIGNDYKEYSDLGESVDLENGMHFVIFNNAPTPVS